MSQPVRGAVPDALPDPKKLAREMWVPQKTDNSEAVVVLF